jgi:hypothetical protein
MVDLTQSHITTLERLIERDFSIVAFPLYANAVGIRRENYVALLQPLTGGGFRFFGEPCYLLDGNLTVRVNREGKSWFVWKKQKVEATAERLAALSDFVSALKLHLESRA